jgi:hypothetical protein
MAHLADRVKDTTTTTGTGNITLAGAAPTGFQTFNAAFGTSAFFYYCVEGGAEWEVGLGHLSASTTLVRDDVISSTNSNNAVSFSAGTKNVFCTLPSKRTPIVIAKLTDESRNTTTTLADDNTLLVPMLASTNYYIKFFIQIYVHEAADFKYAFTVPASGFFRSMKRTVAQHTTITTDIITAIPGSTALTTTTSNYGFIELEGQYANGVNAGNFAFQWAQNTSNGNNVSVIGGSMVSYLEIVP